MITGNIFRLAGLVVVTGLAVFLFCNGCCIAGVGLHLLSVIYLLSGTLNPHSRLFGKIQTTTGDSRIWLTFDDGPDPKDTPVLLDLLKESEVKATFFVVGEKAARHPELIQQMYEQGHQIGNHTWSHPQSTFWCAGPWRTYREIVRCQEVVEKITGEAPVVFRAPVGHHNFFVHPVLRKFGLKLIGWNSRGLDGVSKDVDRVVSRVKESIKPGGIVLAHEGTGIAGEVTTEILEYAKLQGWSFTIPHAGR